MVLSYLSKSTTYALDNVVAVLLRQVDHVVTLKKKIRQQDYKCW